MSLASVKAEQEALTRDWHRAEAFLDKKIPLTPRFHANLERFWQAMDRFDAIENSLRRSGVTECLQGSNCNDQVVSCRACLPIDDTGSMNPVKSSHLGRDRSGKMWVIEELAF